MSTNPSKLGIASEHRWKYNKKILFLIWVHQTNLEEKCAALCEVGHTSHPRFSEPSFRFKAAVFRPQAHVFLDNCEGAPCRTDLLWPFLEAFNPGAIISSKELCKIKNWETVSVLRRPVGTQLSHRFGGRCPQATHVKRKKGAETWLCTCWLQCDLPIFLSTWLFFAKVHGSGLLCKCQGRVRWKGSVELTFKHLTMRGFHNRALTLFVYSCNLSHWLTSCSSLLLVSFWSPESSSSEGSECAAGCKPRKCQLSSSPGL